MSTPLEPGYVRTWNCWVMQIPTTALVDVCKPLSKAPLLPFLGRAHVHLNSHLKTICCPSSYPFPHAPYPHFLSHEAYPAMGVSGSCPPSPPHYSLCPSTILLPAGHHLLLNSPPRWGPAAHRPRVYGCRCSTGLGQPIASAELEALSEFRTLDFECVLALYLPNRNPSNPGPVITLRVQYGQHIQFNSNPGISISGAVGHGCIGHHHPDDRALLTDEVTDVYYLNSSGQLIAFVVRIGIFSFFFFFLILYSRAG